MLCQPAFPLANASQKKTKDYLTTYLGSKYTYIFQPQPHGPNFFSLKCGLYAGCCDSQTSLHRLIVYLSFPDSAQSRHVNSVEQWQHFDVVDTIQLYFRRQRPLVENLARAPVSRVKKLFALVFGCHAGVLFGRQHGGSIFCDELFEPVEVVQRDPFPSGVLHQLINPAPRLGGFLNARAGVKGKKKIY